MARARLGVSPTDTYPLVCCCAGLRQIASLAIRSGNGLMLKGGKEATHSNACLHRIITDALKPDVDPSLISLVTTREGVDKLLALDDVIDLVIPRGSNALVKYIQTHTKIPVLGHADGICHIYVDPAADMDKVKSICVDSKVRVLRATPLECPAPPSGLPAHTLTAIQSKVGVSTWQSCCP